MDRITSMIKKTARMTDNKKKKKTKKAVSKLVRHSGQPKLSAIERMTDSNFVRTRKLAGVIHVRDRKKVYERCKHIARRIVEEIVRPSVCMLQHTGKATLTPKVILHVANAQGRNIYWTEDDEHVNVGGYTDKPQLKKPKAENAVAKAS